MARHGTAWHGPFSRHGTAENGLIEFPAGKGYGRYITLHTSTEQPFSVSKFGPRLLLHTRALPLRLLIRNRGRLESCCSHFVIVNQKKKELIISDGLRDGLRPSSNGLQSRLSCRKTERLLHLLVMDDLYTMLQSMRVGSGNVWRSPKE